MITAGDYSTFSNYSGAVLGVFIPSSISILLGLLQDIETLFDSQIYDPAGRALYIEEGYTVITITKNYSDTDYFASDIEYFIFDKQMTLIFNDVIGKTYMPGF